MADVEFSPIDVLNLRNAVGLPLVSAAFRLAADFIAGENKAWYYYVGAFAGASAAAVGKPGASATLVFAANSVSAYVRKGPDYGEIAVFADGVSQGVIDLESAEEVWELVELFVNPGAVVARELFIILNAEAEDVAWMAFGTFLLSTLDETIPTAEAKESISMPYDTIVFRVRDAESDTNEASVPIRVPSGLSLEEIQAYVTAVAPELNALTEGAITGASVTVNLTLPGGIRTDPTAGSFNERGGLITFDTSGPRADSVWIPAFNKTKMPGSSFSLADTDVAAFITRLTTETTDADIQPRTTQDYEYTAARKGSKSIRK